MALNMKPKDKDIEDPNAVPTGFQTRDTQSEYVLMHHRVSDICTLLDMGEMPDDALEKLKHAMQPYIEIDFDKDFDIREELKVQMKMVNAVRKSILDDAGQIKKETTVTEVKSVLDASMRLSTMLTKVNKELINQERLQAVEASFMAVIGQFTKEQQLEYVDDLEKRMKVQSALQK